MSLSTTIYQNGNKSDVSDVIMALLHDNISSFISNYEKSYPPVSVILGIWLTGEIILRIWGLPLVLLYNVLTVSSLENICIVSSHFQGYSIFFLLYLSPTVHSSSTFSRLSESSLKEHNSQGQPRVEG